MFSESIMLVCLAHLDLSRFVCRSFDASFQQMVLWMRRSQCEAPGLEDCLLKDDHPAVAAELARLSLSSRGGSDNDGDDYDSDDDDDYDDNDGDDDDSDDAGVSRLYHDGWHAQVKT